MTATRSLFNNLVEGRTYQIVADDRESGRVDWSVFRYERIGAELDPGHPVWSHVGARTGEPLPPGYYKPSALAWLAELFGVDSNLVDVVLILPDGAERIEPSVAH